MEQAKEVHGRIQTRHDSLVRELEAAQSELNISHNYLVTLEQQLKTLQEEDHNLAGLLHPIRQCPEDIIRLIFECAAYSEESPLFAVATALSHVCRRWRAIALSISGLWSRIDVSMKLDLIDNLRSFMERVKERVGTTPVNVRIWDVTSGLASQAAFMECMDLRYFKTIATLEYRLVSSQDVLLLREPPFSDQTANVKKLIITKELPNLVPPEWSLARVLGPFPRLEFIQLDGLGVVTFEALNTLPSLHRLHILNMKALHVPRCLAQHLQLQELVITGKEFDMEQFTQDIVLPKLTLLTINSVNGFPWDRISTPLLRTMEMGVNSDSARAFLCRHPAIHTLRYLTPINEAGFKDTAKSMVNLRSLLIGGFIDGLFKEIDPDIPFPPFPKLKMLVIDQLFTAPISLEDFEQLLRIRCLPQEPSDTNKTHRISDLAIAFRTIELNSARWRQSALLARVSQTIKKQGHNEAHCAVWFKIPN